MAGAGVQHRPWSSPTETGRAELARLFVLIGGLIVIALTAALVGPYFIDWTPYRADFEREASRVLGRKVTVSGDASARLLPFPSVTFTNVEVAGDGEGEPSMTVETFSMDAELAPFMRGEFHIFDMRLHKPVMTVDVAPNGLIDWTIRPNTPFDPSQVKLEKISVSDGRITVLHAAGNRTYLLDDIDADISARTLAGPWRIVSRLKFDGSAMNVTVSTGTVGADGAMRLRVEAGVAELPFAVEADGNVRIEDGGAVYAGHFRLEAAETEDDAGGNEDSAFSISVEEKPDESLPFLVTGQFTANHRLLDISEFILETGSEAEPYSADGSAFVDYGAQPNFAVRADGQQIRFEQKDEVTDAGQSLNRRIAALREMVQSVPRPGMDGTINLNLPAIVAGDTTIRQVNLAAKPDESGWQIDALSAELPGRATLEASGLLVSGDAFGFHGSLLLAINQPSGFASWLSNDVDNAIRRLPSAGFSADVNINSERQTFRNLQLILGGAKFTGEVDHFSQSGAKPAMLLRLDGGALDVDGLAAFASIFVNDAGAARFADHDLDLVIKAGPVSVAGLTAGKLDTALRLKDGLLDIDRFSVQDLAGATIGATGKLKHFPASPTGSLDASIVSVDLLPLVETLASSYPQNGLISGLAERGRAFPELLADTRIDLVASAATNDDDSHGLAISAHGQGGGGRFSASVSATARDNQLEGPLSLTLTMNNKDAAPIYAAYGLPAIPLRLTGPAETSLILAGEMGSLFETKLQLRGEGSEANFEGWAGVVDGAWQATGDASIRSNDIEPWLATAGVTLPGFGQGLPANIKAVIDHSGTTLHVAELAGKINDSPVVGDVFARFQGEKPAISGSISLPSVDMSPVGTLLLGEQTLQFGPEGEPASKPFVASSNLPVAAKLDLAVSELAFGLNEPLQQARLKFDLNDEGVRISDLEAEYRGGRISGLAELKKSGGTALFSTQFRYQGFPVSDLAQTANVGGKAALSANLTASGKSFAGLLSSLSGSGSMVLEELSIPGTSPDVFAQFVEAADKIGKEIDADDVAGFGPPLVASGPFETDVAEFTFVLAGGVLRTPAVIFENANARMQAEINTDFNQWRASAEAEIAYDPGREAVVGATPVVFVNSSGPIGAMTASYDTGPLAQFLTQRALELEQFRVESLQAGLLEKQRLRREVRYYASLERKRREEEEARLQANQDGEEGGTDGSIPSPDPDLQEEPEALEDAVRRILDEEAKKHTDDDARLDDGNEQNFAAPQITETIIVERLPVPSETQSTLPVVDGEEVLSASEPQPADRAFETLVNDRLTIDEYLRSVGR